MRKFVLTFFDTKDSSSSKVVKLQGKHTLPLDKNNSSITKTAPPPNYPFHLYLKQLSGQMVSKSRCNSAEFILLKGLYRIYVDVQRPIIMVGGKAAQNVKALS